MTEQQEAAMRLALEAMKETLRTLDDENAKPGGAIADTIWYTPHQTLFDYLEEQIAALTAALEQPASGIKQVIELYDKPEQPAQEPAISPDGGTGFIGGVWHQPAQQKPVAWIEHEWSGTGLKHLHFERREPTVRDEVVCPVWTPLCACTCTQAREPAQQIGTIGHIGEGKATLTAAVAPMLKEQMTAQQEPFGYFKPEPFGWTDCAETDEGAVALYDRPQAREPLTDEQLESLIGDWSFMSWGERIGEVRRIARTIEAAHGITGEKK